MGDVFDKIGEEGVTSREDGDERGEASDDVIMDENKISSTSHPHLTSTSHPHIIHISSTSTSHPHHIHIHISHPHLIHISSTHHPHLIHISTHLTSLPSPSPPHSRPLHTSSEKSAAGVRMTSKEDLMKGKCG